MSDEVDPQRDMLHALSAHGGLIRLFSDELNGLSDAAAMLGSDRLAKRLEIIAAGLSDSFAALHRAHGEALAADLAASQQATTNMITAAIAGIKIGAANRPEPKVSP